MGNAENFHDVVILGGGLAGLTLALQLKRRKPDIRIVVLERRAHPVPEAAHKVGESSVEIGAHYFDKVLGLGEHLRNRQLRKFGFRFFFSEGRRDIDQVTEIGASRHLTVPSYQIDRGIFENFLALEAQERGIEFIPSATVRRVDLTDDEESPSASHQVIYEHQGVSVTATARWVIDACGRAGLLKRKLGLALSNSHAAHAVWFRIKARITIDHWSSNTAWRERCEPQARWLSTNHLVGTGYWVWLIPLSSGSHSVGIVADPAIHPLERMDSFPKAMAWLEQYQPRLFDELDTQRELLQDFAFFKRFSYGCKQVFSAKRWALTGEAGLFLDPFYSPGNDFIAISNTYITELVVLDSRGERIGARAQIFDQLLHSFYDSTLALYQDQYAIFGDPEVLPVKVIWDYTYYWGILAQFFFNNRLTDLASLAALRTELAECQQLNLAVQVFLRQWSQVSCKRNPPVMLDQARMPWFAELNRSLNDDLDTAGFQARIRASHTCLKKLASEILQRARMHHPTLDCGQLAALLPLTASTASHSEDACMLPATDYSQAEPGATCDVLVIGGGPAGSTVASLLAEKGHHVVMLEKAHHPRFHIGESLLPANLPLFEKMGIADQVRAIGMHKPGAEFVSLDHGRAQTVHFAQAWDKSMPKAYQVRRAEFDDILFRHAAAKGAHVHEGTKVTQVDFLAEGGAQVRAICDDGHELQVRARFVVDASGRDTFLAHRLKTKQRNPRHNSAAVYAHFEGASRHEGSDAGNISIFWFAHGWFWFIPLTQGTTSIGMVTWPYHMKSRGERSLQGFMMDSIATCPPLQERLKTARLVSQVEATGNFSYASHSSHGTSHLLLGDAYAFIDPVFSSGVWLAMHSAVVGADTIDCCLRSPHKAGAALKHFDRVMRHGPQQFSWFIYRVTNPIMRDFLMGPKNIFRVKEAILSVLAGDIFGKTPIWRSIWVFKAIYYAANILQPKRAFMAWRQRRLNIRKVDDSAPYTA